VAYEMKYVALLRGINVGGRSLIKMADLVGCVRALGYGDVTTYIASGNVLFDAAKLSATTLEAEIERAIEGRFGVPVRVTVRNGRQMTAIVERIPSAWIGDATKRVSVGFLLDRLDSRTAARELKPKEGIDEVVTAAGALLFATRRDAITRTGLKLVGTRLYKQLTIRNLNTAMKLAELVGSNNSGGNTGGL
jgi:uncharacterized protein (DUF1697 family)